MKKGELTQIREAIITLTNHYSEIKRELWWHRWMLCVIVGMLLAITAGLIVKFIGG